jgi:voltage-gated potassium channel
VLIIVILLKKMVGKITKTHPTFILLATVFFLVLGTFGGYYAENPVNSGFRNLGDSLWWTVVTMSTVGYGDIVPKTLPGRIIGTICMFGGPLLVVSLIGSVGISLYNRWTKGVKGMGQVKSSGHIVICGWNKKAKDIIDELKASELRDRPITIIDDKIEARPLEDSKISFIRGNASELNTLNRANISGAEFAIVLAEDSTPIADQRTVLTVLAIEKTNPSIVSCAELIDINNEEHLRRAGCNIVINASIIASRLMAMSLQNPVVNRIIGELVSQEGNEVYRIPVPQRYIGRSFIDTFPEMKKLYNIIPIGLERDGECLLNPDANLFLKVDDLLLVLSEEKPDIG